MWLFIRFFFEYYLNACALQYVRFLFRLKLKKVKSVCLSFLLHKIVFKLNYSEIGGSAKALLLVLEL